MEMFQANPEPAFGEDKKHYDIYTVQVQDKILCEYFEASAHIANNMYNSALYTLRQVFTGMGKYPADRHKKQNEEIEKVFRYVEMYNECHKNKVKVDAEHSVLSYSFLDFYFKHNGNENYKHEYISSHSSQHLIKEARQKILDFIAAVKKYKTNPKLFTGPPQIPHYKKSGGIKSYVCSNQVCKIKNGFLEFPKTKLKLNFSVKNTGRFKQVTISKSHCGYRLSLYFERPIPSRVAGNVTAAIDPGVNNLLSMVTDDGKSLIISGNMIKCENKKYNNRIAKVQRAQTIGTDKKIVSSKKLQTIYKKRNSFITDFMHQTAVTVMEFAVENNVGTIVIGRNPLWKQKVNKGHENNQTFCEIPHSLLAGYIAYKAARLGIKVVFQEESYTSRANALRNDFIPVYGEENGETFTFTGKRIYRGLYRSDCGRVINADLNGALNILRKYTGQDIVYGNIRYLTNPKVIKNIYKHRHLDQRKSKYRDNGQVNPPSGLRTA